jgi:alpha-L-fucosidase 2
MKKLIKLILLLGCCARVFAATEMEVKSDIAFAKISDVSLKLDVYTPKEARGPYPTVLWVHGGGFVSGDKKQFPRLVLDPLFDRGWAMVSVNYRLSPQHPFPAAPDDVESGISYIKKHAREWNVDPNKLVLMGESAGGLLVSVAGARARPENHVAAVVSFYGEHDLILRVTENPCIMDGKAVPMPPGGCLSPGIAAFLGIKEVNDDTTKIVREASAVTYVKKDMPPYLLIHGTREFHVPFEQAVSLKMAMDKAGADCKLIPILGGAHGLGGWERLPQAKGYKEQMIAWLEEKLQLK